MNNAELHIQKKLRELEKVFRYQGLAFSELETKHAIKAKRHTQFPNLVLFKYDMIEANFDDPMVCECRGIILNSADDWSIVSRSYDKFFNHGEGRAAEIDWSTARVQEKVDGSLCVLYWYDNAWQVQTSGMPDAAGGVEGWDVSFKDLFWNTWNELGYRLPIGPSELCYAFELCTPMNKVIVQHKSNRLVLHGVRIRTTGEHLSIDSFRSYGWEIVQELKLGSWEEILETSKLLDPIAQEGYVVVDKQWRRVKVKTPQYVALAHMRDGMGPRRMLELVRANESSEFLTYFPEWTDLYKWVQEKYEALLNQLEIAYNAIKHFEIQKDFAMSAVNYQMSGILFQKRKTPEKTIKELLAEANINTLIDVLKLRSLLNEKLGSEVSDQDS